MSCVLNLYAIRSLERILKTPEADIRAIAARPEPYYQPFSSRRKRRPFQRETQIRKLRRIDNPTGLLKLLQGRIYRRLLARLDFPDHIFGGVKGRSALDNARSHSGTRLLVTMDVRDCFPSITAAHVYKVWRNLLNCSDEIALLLTNLTTFEGYLPQGAPTSTALANLVIYSLDEPIRLACAASGVRYSTLVDDLALSGDRGRELINYAVGVFGAAGLSMPHRKLRIMGGGSRKILNGHIVGENPGVPRERIKWARSGIHKLDTGRVPARWLPKYLQRLRGTISHISSVNPRAGSRLLRNLESALARINEELPPGPFQCAPSQEPALLLPPRNGVPIEINE